MRVLTLALVLALASCRGGDGVVVVVGDPGDDDDHDGYSEDDGDCDDGDPLAYPGAAERCNNFDDDCDGYIDVVAEVTEGEGVGIWHIGEDGKIWDGINGRYCQCGGWYTPDDNPFVHPFLCN